jgi:hypothetical protein
VAATGVGGVISMVEGAEALLGVVMRMLGDGISRGRVAGDVG